MIKINIIDRMNSDVLFYFEPLSSKTLIDANVSPTDIMHNACIAFRKIHDQLISHWNEWLTCKIVIIIVAV